MKTTLDSRINDLRPGGSVRLSASNGLTVSAERSGDGKTLRFVRSSPAGFTVIKSGAF